MRCILTFDRIRVFFSTQDAWIDSQKDEPEERVGVMKFYIHGYPRQIRSVSDTLSGNQEVQSAPASGRRAPSGASAHSGPRLRTVCQRSKDVKLWIWNSKVGQEKVNIAILHLSHQSVRLPVSFSVTYGSFDPFEK